MIWECSAAILFRINVNVILSRFTVILISLCIWGSCIGNSRPDVVNIGAIFTLSSLNGRVAEIGMKAAVEDINSDPSVLGGRKLVLSIRDSNFSGFSSIIGGLTCMENDTVAIIGPQVSQMARIISLFANELHVPMLSFSALDPGLSSRQYPYFIQTAPNDVFQVEAIADVVRYFDYREVIVLYSEQNAGIVLSLSNKLAERRSRICYRAVLSQEVNISREEIRKELTKISLMESRVIVVNTFVALGTQVFDEAHKLGMMSKGYVWIATGWLSTVLDSTTVSRQLAKSIQGVLIVRPHIPDSEQKRAFVSRWNKFSNDSIGLNHYGLYAYDTVWIVANAVKVFLDQGGEISFSKDSHLEGFGGSTLNLDALSIFDGGEKLLENILRANMTGLTGEIAFTPERSVIRPAFEILNVVGQGYREIGYWSNYSGLSVLPPETLYAKPPNRSSASQQLSDVIWPGQTTVRPRGWVFPHNVRELTIGVPNRVSYTAFVSKNQITNEIHGYCIDVFLAAIKLLPYELPHKFVLFGDGQKNPNYGELINNVASGVFDAAVGDIAMVPSRLKIADFTQPYIDSGLNVVVPIKIMNGPWIFTRPFTLWMWVVTWAFFLVVGAVIWIVEHKVNDQFRGPPKRQFITVLWFAFSTMVFAHKENVVSALARMVLVFWLFVVLIITSSYTASFTSILTVQRLSPSIRGIESLTTTSDRIGYQVGSFSENLLVEEFNIARSRLVALGSAEEYADALSRGRVAAIVDESPYIDLFLSQKCNFQIVGEDFANRGWGFAFQKDSPLATDISTAILTLSDSGELKKIRDKYLNSRNCSRTSSEEPAEFQLRSFMGLFAMCGFACIVALLIHFYKILRKFKRHYNQEPTSDQPRLPLPVQIQRFLSFANKKQVESRNQQKRKHIEMNSSRKDTRISVSRRSSGSCTQSVVQRGCAV